MTETTPTIGVIDRRRRMLDLSQRQLCAAAGISVATYTRTKRGHTRPLAATLDGLAAALDRLAAEQVGGAPARSSGTMGG